MIVLACNTASAVCYDELKKQNADLPIIKIAPYSNYKKLDILPTIVMVTNNTAKFYPKLKLIQNYKNIHLHPFAKLAKKIDDANGNFDLVLPYLKNELCKYEHMGIKNIVLGCTHYNHIRPQLKKIFGKVKFFENSSKVATKCKNWLLKNDMQNKTGDGRTIIFCKL